MANDLADGIWGGGLGTSVAVQELAARLARCAGRTEEVLNGFREIQMLEWQSPAGQAYRDAVSLQAVAVRRAVDRLHEASVAVAAHARAALTSDCSYGGRP
ncbi:MULTISPECIES: hypothetical protein [unclassified Arthrobacter]|uniref:hypothetical protein n=1 Tax=unclassified Arthrobacter TaxID=235627 RepID=UPI001C84D52D|nr:hypothetical protein [Arthrobacter sp. MAHUQ-56]MBX7443126.1 hypothetical protein [Arthrobacter sp. MAHUQ-56]